MELKYSATVKLEKRNNKEGELITINVPLLIDVTFYRQRVFLNVGFRIDASTFANAKGELISKWNFETQRAATNTVHAQGKHADNKAKAKDINDGIENLLARIKGVFKSFEHQKITPTKEQFKNALNPKAVEHLNAATADTSLSFYEYFDLYIEQGKSKWQPNTIKKHNTAKSHLLAFDKDLTFEALNNHLKLDAFVAHLNNAGLRNVSAEKYLKVLKWFLKWAVLNEYTQFKKFLLYKPTLENLDKDVIFLTQKEFTHLYNLEIKQPHLDRVRDAFCFSCVTGLRWSDLNNLKRSQIKDGIIYLTTVKTNDNLKIQLNKYSSAILDKYKDDIFEDGKALPIISNQKSNEYLKRICKDAGFNENIEINYKVGIERKTENRPKHDLMSMHAGRRTFVCLGLFLGLTPKVIASFTGHKSAEAMKPYEKIVEEMKSKEMQKFNF